MAVKAISSILTELDDLRRQNVTTPLPEQTLQELRTLLQGAGDDPETMERFYEALASRKLPVSSLTLHICSAIESGPGPGLTRISLLGSDVYLSLILAPSAPVFTLFSPMAFLSLLHSVRRFFKYRQVGQPDEPGSGSSSGKRRGGGRAKKSQRSNIRHRADDSDFGILVSVLKSLELVMDLVHLDRFAESLKSLIQTVAEIPVLSLDSFPGLGGQYCKLNELCSRILSKVLSPGHGEVAESAAEVLKSLCPIILSGKSPARNFALTFVKDTMMRLAEESEGVQKALTNLPRYLAHKAPEKAEPRALAAESIMEIVRMMEHTAQIEIVEYVVKMTQGKSNLRLLGVDLLVNLMISLGATLQEDGNSTDMEMRNLWLVNSLRALLNRCSDSNSIIRARALSNLAQLIEHFLGNGRNVRMFKEVLGVGDAQRGGINELLQKRCVDEKAAVRRSAINLVTKLTALMGGSFDANVLKTLGMACSDPLVSIRKAAVLALSEAFRKFQNENVTIEWLHSVPRLITDNETSLQEECEELFLELVLDHVSAAEGSSSVLCLLREICHGEVSPWVKKVCTNLGKKNRLRPRVALSLQNVIRESERVWLSRSWSIERWTAPQGAWFLLSEVSAYVPKSVEWEFLHHYWELLDNNADGGGTQSFPVENRDLFDDQNSAEADSISWANDRVFLLQTISNVSLELPSGPAADLAQKLLKRIEGFNMHSTEVKAHVKALKTLCKQKASSQDEAEALVQRWVHQLLLEASRVLEKYISEVDSQTVKKEPNFFTTPRSENRCVNRRSKSLSRANAAVYTIGSLLLACHSADTSTVVPILHTIITSGNLNTDPKLKKLTDSSVSFKQIAPSLYIQGWVTMGKICLADGKLAKRYLPLFVQELERCDLAALRNNLIVIMADFCVRYTALVDCYIKKITRCLCDPCELVRRQTFILLSRLLQRDYVKWKGVLFLRFLLSLVDESEKIRQLSDYLFGNILKVKAPLLAYNSFVEAVFVLNDCRAHSGHSTSQGPRAESRLFSIRGNDESSRSKRMHIYVSLLKQMAPEHLLATSAKICAEILAAASDGMLDIEDQTGQSVLQDAFQILACKEIRIPTGRGATSDSPEIEEDAGDSGASSLSSAAKGRAISQVVRKGLIQNMIPIFIELKRLLEGKNSPLIGSLMDCLRLLLKDYRHEIEDMLVADKQLQKELLYDMQKHEAAARARMEEASTQAAEATARSVLREVNRGIATPPLKSLSVPKVKGSNGRTGPTCRGGQSDRPKELLESLRRKQPFIPEGEE